jgi:hypothetical protein
MAIPKKRRFIKLIHAIVEGKTLAFQSILSNLTINKMQTLSAKRVIVMESIIISF